jgi:hypothetical protein
MNTAQLIYQQELVELWCYVLKAAFAIEVLRPATTSPYPGLGNTICLGGLHRTTVLKGNATRIATVIIIENPTSDILPSMIDRVSESSYCKHSSIAQALPHWPSIHVINL